MLPFFLDPFYEKREARKKEYFKTVLVPRAVDFDFMAFKWTDLDREYKTLCLRAATYKPELLFDTPVVDASSELKKTDITRPGTNWTWAYRNQRLPAGQDLSIAQGKKRGSVVFDADVIIPCLVKYRPKHWDPWDICMSLTPLEMISQRGAIRRARGRVLIGGLGLGWLARRVAEKKSVESVVVAEIDAELIAWYGERAVHPGTEIINADVFDVMKTRGESFDHILLDVWDGYGGNAEDDTLVKVLKKKPELKTRTWVWGSQYVA